MTDAFLAGAVADSLEASGIPAAAQVTDDGSAWLALALESDASVVAYLELADLSYAVTSDVRAQRMVPTGPLGPRDVRCNDATCVSAHILAWVLSWRARQH